MIPKATVDLILDTAQVVDVIGDFVSLKKRGASYIACCPFHNEKTPSFIVTPAKGIYKCFGCGKSGTAVGFIMEHESLTYPEALKWLAKRYNIEVQEKEESAEEIAARQHGESLYLVSEFAAKFFAGSLDKDGGVGYQYLRSRGLEDETIRRFGLGWSPADRTALLTAAKAEGFKEEYLVDAGLCIRREDGSVYDRFAERVIFPIYSATGRVIAFGGRTLRTDKSVAKYVNSPETAIYEKNKALYGISLAKNAISKADRCILVEGNVDVVSMHQLGLSNVVASCGTSLTANQVDFIHRFTDNVTIMYDADAAGVHGALRGMELVLAAGMNVKAVLLPEGEDPDSYSRKVTREEFEEYIRTHEQDLVDYVTDMVLGDNSSDPLKKAEVLNQIADLISLMPDRIKRQTYIESAAKRFGVEQDLLSERSRATREKRIIDEQKRRERENSQRQAQEPATPAGGEVAAPAENPRPRRGVTPMPFASELTDRELASSELALLDFMLNNGLDELMFSPDSEFRPTDGGSITVAEFIDNSLAGDSMDFVNEIYAKVYDTYFELFDQGLDQQKIQTRLLNSEDPQIAAVARELLIDKYALTVENYVKSLTKTETILVINVPRAMMIYQSKRVEKEIAEKTRALASPDAGNVEELLADISRLSAIKVMLKNRLGHV
ncbi:MAG: DNA primase [Bacteroidales bacterium]|nr:DNA primase [Bacteroidales bacterium]